MKEKARKILEILMKTFGNVDLNEFLAFKVALETRDPFETLVATILTQNTNEKNAFRSYFSLKRKFPKITPEILARISVNELASSISHGGLGFVKAKRIIEASKYVIEKFGNDLSTIFEKPLEEARNELMRIPGVGPKTADILLLMIANKPTIPVDTHVMRVSYRLGFTVKEVGYEATRRKLVELFCPDKCLEAHLYLILLGRRFCIARKPKCDVCPVSHLCAKAI